MNRRSARAVDTDGDIHSFYFQPLYHSIDLCPYGFGSDDDDNDDELSEIESSVKTGRSTPLARKPNRYRRRKEVPHRRTRYKRSPSPEGHYFPHPRRQKSKKEKPAPFKRVYSSPSFNDEPLESYYRPTGQEITQPPTPVHQFDVPQYMPPGFDIFDCGMDPLRQLAPTPSLASSDDIGPHLWCQPNMYGPTENQPAPVMMPPPTPRPPYMPPTVTSMSNPCDCCSLVDELLNLQPFVNSPQPNLMMGINPSACMTSNCCCGAGGYSCQQPPNAMTTCSE